MVNDKAIECVKAYIYGSKRIYIRGGIINQMQYKLIAFDMDGTLLNDRHEIPERTLRMIGKACSAGKTVVLSTGRCIPELRHYFSIIPGLTYTICVSGAMVYDVRHERVLFRDPISPEVIRNLLDTVRGEDIIVHFLGEESIIEKDMISHMDHYAMGQHKEMFERVTTKVDDIYSYHSSRFLPVEKVNFFCPTSEKQKELAEKTRGLGLAVAFGEGYSVEFTAGHVNKGTGLIRLCRQLSIPLSETIAVGDGDNDLAMFQTAGFSVAMGNANPEVCDMADAVVADNNHDGCAEAIEKYLLGSKPA